MIISTDRAKRPTDFLRSTIPPPSISPRACPFCAGNESQTPPEILAYGRNGSGPNSAGWSLRVVPNRFPALGIEGDLDREGEGLFDKMNGIGAHEVIIETPDHAATPASMPEKAMEEVFWAFRERMLDLKRDRRFRYILIFKNHGEAAGATLEHSHSQLIALPIVPRRVREEVDNARQYLIQKERCVFCDIIRQEIEDETRVVLVNDSFVALAPYAPRFPFEMWVLPRKHASAFEESPSPAFPALARLMSELLRRMDAALERPAYNFMIHTSPVGEEINDHYHWHIELIPKLTKVAGFEWGSGFYINPTPPEESAEFLRDVAL